VTGSKLKKRKEISKKTPEELGKQSRVKVVGLRAHIEEKLDSPSYNSVSGIPRQARGRRGCALTAKKMI